MTYYRSNKKKLLTLLFALILATAISGCSYENVSAGDTWEEIPEDHSGAETEDPLTGDTGSVASSDQNSSEKEEASPAGDDDVAEDDAAENGTSQDDAEQDAADAGDAAGADDTVNFVPGEAEPLVIPEVTDPSDLDQLMAYFMAVRGLNADNFSVSFQNLATGQTWYFNELAVWTPASTYKLPLNMYYYDMQAEGRISGDSIIPGTGLTLSECHRRSLVNSDNPSSQAMLSNLDFVQFKQDVRRYFTLSDSEIQDIYWHRNFYCTRMMMETARYLYQHADQYQEALQYLYQAQPGMYFRRYIPDCLIAQKYGSLDGWENCVGIIWADQPIALCVYTYGVGEETVARTAELIKNYVNGTVQIESAGTDTETADTDNKSAVE